MRNPELEALDAEFNDGEMHLHAYRARREQLLAKIARAPAPQPPAPPPPSPRPAGVSIEMLRRVLAALGKDYGKAIREMVRDPLRAKIGELEARLKALEERPTMKYRGVWDEATQYNEAEIVTDHGSAWFCNRSTRSRPGIDSNWQLMVKRGRDR